MNLYIITGFLGAGKTTCLYHLLEYLNEDSAVIINEYGELSIDTLKLQAKENRIREITGGSIFCACKQDKFIEAMMQVYQEKPSSIVVETSGFADPSSLWKTIRFLESKGLSFNTKMITVVDACHAIALSNTIRVIQNQIKYANLIIINKSDLVDETTHANVLKYILETNQEALMIEATKCEIDYHILDETNVYKDVANDEKIIKSPEFSSVVISLKNILDLEYFNQCINNIKDKVYRIKGYILIDGTLYLYELSGNEINYSIEENIQSATGLVVLYSTKEIGKATILEELKEFTI